MPSYSFQFITNVHQYSVKLIHNLHNQFNINSKKETNMVSWSVTRIQCKNKFWHLTHIESALTGFKTYRLHSSNHSYSKSLKYSIQLFPVGKNWENLQDQKEWFLRTFTAISYVPINQNFSLEIFGILGPIFLSKIEQHFWLWFFNIWLSKNQQLLSAHFLCVE